MEESGSSASGEAGPTDSREAQTVVLREDSGGTVPLGARGSDGERSKADEAHGDPSDRVEGYRIVRAIASGGMGTVYEAEQLNPRRRVALKVVKRGAVTPRMVRRFEFEAQILARLDHPGIARVHEAGTFDSGAGPQPYFAMEFVEGRPPTRWAEERGLPIRDRLELMAKVCDAVEHAHRKGVIHRDLKPDNILVVDDGTRSGQPKVLDFGLARDFDAQAATMGTQTGQILGTPLYMSPEQWSGRPDDLDTRSDVYSIGVVAWEVLAGRHPIDARGKSLFELLEAIRDSEPAPISTTNPAFRGDVETILAKALARERERRYASASELGADIRRYLNDEPVSARRSSAFYQMRKFARRNRALVASSVAGVLALAMGLGVALVQMRVAQRERGVAEAARADADAALATALAERNRAERERNAARFEQYAATIRSVAAMADAGLNEQAAAALETCPEELRGWEWGHLVSRSLGDASLRGDRLFLDTEPRMATLDLGFAEEGDAIATIDFAAARVRDANDGREIAAIEAPIFARALDLDLSDDATRLAASSPSGRVEVFDPRTMDRLYELPRFDFVPRSMFSRSGETLWVSRDAAPPRVFSAADGAERPSSPARAGILAAVDDSPDGDRVLGVYRSGPVVVWENERGWNESLLLAEDRGEILAGAFSPNGGLIAAAFSDGRVRIWNGIDGTPLHELAAHSRAATAVAFDREGERLFTGGSDGAARVWDVERGRDLLAISPWDGAPVAAIVLDRERTTVASCLSLGARVWGAAPWKLEHLPAEWGSDWRERFARWRREEGRDWKPSPSPDAGAPIFVDDFETTASLARWNLSDMWKVEDGALQCLPPATPAHRMAFAEIGIPDLDAFALEADVRAPAGSRFAVAYKFENGRVSSSRVRAFRSLGFGLDRFEVHRPGLLEYRSDGAAAGWFSYPGILTNIRNLETEPWTWKERFRLRLEVRGEDCAVFVDGRWFGRRAKGLPGLWKGSVGLLHFLGDGIESARYERFAVLPLAPPEP